MAKKKRHAPEEEEAGEAWLLPYSDLMTLLLALFICLFGISKLNAGKAAQMGASFRSAFNLGGSSFFEGAGVGLGQYGSTPGGVGADKGMSAYLKENEQLEDTADKINEYIEAHNLNGTMSTYMTEGGLLVRISDQALFPSGSAELLQTSERVVPIIGDLLAELPEQVVISGHTDNVPISTPRYPSNWELSNDRALSFMRLLLQYKPQLDPKRFSTLGYGEYRPAASNDTEEGRQRNRRVEVLVSRLYRMPDDTQKVH